MATFTWQPCAARPFLEPPPARMGHIAVAVDATAVWGEEFVVIHGGLGADKRTLDDIAVLPTSDEGWFRPDAQVPVMSSAASDISGTAASRAPSSPANSALGGVSDAPARAFHSAVALGRSVYIFGGHVYHKERKGLHKFNDVWCLNTDNWEWRRIHVPPHSPRPPARDFASMVELPGQRLLVFGGLDSAERRLDDSWMLDVTTSTWSEVKITGGPRPRARFGQCLFQLEQRVLLFGGEGPNGVTNDLWALRGVVAADADVAPAWSPLELPGPVPAPRKGHAAACVAGQVLIMGGHSSENSWFRAKQDMLLNDLSMLDRSQGVHWTAPSVLGAAPAAREFHTLTPLQGGGRLLLFGGGNGKTVFGDAWWLHVEGDLTGSPLVTPPHNTLAPIPPRVPSLAHVRTLSTTTAALDRTISASRSLHDGYKSTALQPSMAMKQLYKRVGVSTAGTGTRTDSIGPGVDSALPLGRIGSWQSTGAAVMGSASDGPNPVADLLEKLGQQVLAGIDVRLPSAPVSPPLHPVAAARQLLGNVPVQQLTLLEVQLLLTDYRTLCTMGLHYAVAAAAGSTSSSALETATVSARGHATADANGAVEDGAPNNAGVHQSAKGNKEQHATAAASTAADPPVAADERGDSAAEKGSRGAVQEGSSAAGVVGEEDVAAEQGDEAVAALAQVATGFQAFCKEQVVVPGRWCHMQVHLLRMSDIQTLQEEYRLLLPAAS